MVSYTTQYPAHCYDHTAKRVRLPRSLSTGQTRTSPVRRIATKDERGSRLTERATKGCWQGGMCRTLREKAIRVVQDREVHVGVNCAGRAHIVQHSQSAVSVFSTLCSSSLPTRYIPRHGRPRISAPILCLPYGQAKDRLDRICV